MERMCQECGGLIGELGKAYGWAGKWCLCGGGFPPTPEMPRVVPLPSIDEYAKQLAPSTPAFSPSDFVHWLRGYAAHGHVDPKILTELQKVRP